MKVFCLPHSTAFIRRNEGFSVSVAFPVVKVCIWFQVKLIRVACLAANSYGKQLSVSRLPDWAKLALWIDEKTVGLYCRVPFGNGTKVSVLICLYVRLLLCLCWQPGQQAKGDKYFFHLCMVNNLQRLVAMVPVASHDPAGSPSLQRTGILVFNFH